MSSGYPCVGYHVALRMQVLGVHSSTTDSAAGKSPDFTAVCPEALDTRPAAVS